MWDSIKTIKSSDENVSKYVFSKTTAVAEAVLYKYPTYADRTVICCSTQSGCPMGCRFCGAGDYFVGSLSTEEIVAQPVRLINDTGINAEDMKRLQIMFMSMGEPLLNLPNLIPALRELYRLYPNAALLISTSAPKAQYDLFREISKEIPTIGLQFSVHESTDAARNKLIPIKGKLSLAGIAFEGVAWHHATGRRPFFNYCVHEGNNKEEDIQRLLDLFDPTVWNATLSVICERDESVAAANERQRELASNFAGMMLSNGYNVRVFNPAGQDDIGGGCGQLWFVQDWMRNNPDKAKPSVGFGKDKVHTPGIPMGGYPRQELTVVAAVSNVGKTIFGS
jgi:23S rRNA (adenine2503-C2)-methyltransferase